MGTEPPEPAALGEGADHERRRVAAVDARLDGRAIPRGTALTLDLRAAYRDPAVFEDPDRFDPGRRERPHLTFGAGRRRCPGTGHALQATVAAALGVTGEDGGGPAPSYGDVQRLVSGR